MIVAIKLSGGLGNQLFQYAAGRALADKFNAKLYLDKSFYLKSPNRKFLLDEFNIIHNFITKKEIIKTFLNRKQKFSDLFKSDITIIENSANKFVELNLGYNGDFEKVNPPVVLEGYWQSDKYFSQVSNKLKSEISLRVPLDIKLIDLKNEIVSLNSVAIHLRRGDYVSNKEINQIHGTCDDEYYLNAIEELKRTENDISLFIFSDDKEAAINFQKKIGTGVVVSNEVALNDIQEFHLMSCCKHFVIANSTFSWWAAWLSKNESKVVFAPRKWFKDESKNDSDLIPEKWRRI